MCTNFKKSWGINGLHTIKKTILKLKEHFIHSWGFHMTYHGMYNTYVDINYDFIFPCYILLEILTRNECSLVSILKFVISICTIKYAHFSGHTVNFLFHQLYIALHIKSYQHQINCDLWTFLFWFLIQHKKAIPIGYVHFKN